MNNAEPLSPICYRHDARRVRDEIRESVELYERVYDSLMEIAEVLEKRSKP